MMRLLLANGTTISVKSYNNTTALVDGNSVPAISIVTAESLDSVNAKLVNTDALLDFNIYPEDKSVVLFHATGYQKRIRTILEDGEDGSTGVTILLAKTTDTDVILKRVEKLLTTIQQTQEEQGESISTLADTQKKTSNELDNVGQKNKQLDQLVKNIGDSLIDINKHIQTVNIHMSENDELCNAIKESVSDFTEISAQHIAEIQGMRSDFKTVSDSASKAVNTADTAANTVTTQNEVIQQAVIAAGDAGTKATQVSNDLTLAVNKLTDVADQVSEVSKVAEDTKNNAASADSVKELTESMSTMKENISAVTETAAKASKGVETISGQTIPVLDQAIKNATNNSKDALEQAGALDKRVSVLEPVTDYTTLSLEDAIAFRVKESAAALSEYLAANPITSTCHKGIAAKYSITKDKQEYLQSMISVCTLAKQNGTPYQPSWNATGEVCSYDWTIEELVKLAMEIEATVRPLVSYQQTIENKIKKCTSMDELKAVVINYNNVPTHTTPTTPSGSDTSETKTPSESTSTSESTSSETTSTSESTKDSTSESTSGSQEGNTSASTSKSETSASDADAKNEAGDDVEQG